MIFEVVYYFRSSKKMSNELQAKLDELWNRVQSNEESISIKKQILNECNEIITNTSIKDNRFLLNKLKLIIHKAGKPMNLSLLAEEFEAVAKLEPNNIDVYIEPEHKAGVYLKLSDENAAALKKIIKKNYNSFTI